MDENFTKFNIDSLNKIVDFINSQFDLLYISGFQGCGKSEIVNKALNNIDEDILLFRHLCFENSVIDDFLLGFYDTLRYYSLSKKINLKKGLSENFAQKVSFYFKNLEKKSLIIIDNFEIISTNSEIMDFLAHLGKYENVKLILISRVLNTEFFEEKGLNSNIIDIASNDYFTFKLKVQNTLSACTDEDIEEFYNSTKGYELYLKMALRYIATVNITLKDFMEEFKKRNVEFADFLISKIVSLVPPIYLPFLQNMSCLNHAVNIAFIENYGLGDISLINYLYRKMLVSKFDDEIYLKDYLKQYFLSNLSIKEKMDNYKNLIKIYENELAKSPKERLLRLSRESIRKQIESVKTKLPNINRPQSFSGSSFSYIKQAENAPIPWYAKLSKLKQKGFEESSDSTQTKQGPQLVEKNLSDEEWILIEEFRKNKSKKVEEQIVLDNDNILEKIEKLEEKFDYAGVIDTITSFLKNISDKPKDNNFIKQIYLKLAQNYTKINNFEEALNNFSNAINICKTLNDMAEIINIKLLEADLYKKLYKLEKAKATLHEAISLSIEYSKNGAARGYLALGEIYEMKNNFKSAFENYNKALKYTQDYNEDKVLLPEIYYKIGTLYDDGQNTENALEYYQKSIDSTTTLDNKKVFGFLSSSYANMGLIYSELWGESGSNKDKEKAILNLQKALETDTKYDNSNGIYTICKQLAAIYKDTEPKKTLEYLYLVLNASQKMNDSFKIALSHLEIGDYYYNAMDNVLALRNYLEAKKALGTSISDENKERITVRINDMRIKMENSDFDEILKEYE